MKFSMFVTLAAGLLIVTGLAGCKSASDSASTASDDLKKAQGTWILLSGEKDGAPLSEEDIKDSKLTIVGDTYDVHVGTTELKKGTQKLHSTKTPKQIDAQDTEGPTVGENLGIYEFTPNGDFRVCFSPTGKERPTEFATKPGSGIFIHVWQRAKAE
jgi:uncharacterized protein (TIGR03067 family)